MNNNTRILTENERNEYAGELASKIAKELVRTKNNYSSSFNSGIPRNNGVSRTRFIYRINAGKKLLTFTNFNVDYELRGQKILARTLDLIEPICDILNYTIEIDTFVNLKLAKYFKVKRHYKIFNLIYKNKKGFIEIKDLSHLNKYIVNKRNSTINTLQVPSFAIRAPRV